MRHVLAWFVSLCLLTATSVAEGTREIRPAAANVGNLHLTNNPTYTDFAQYGAPPEHQIKIRIADVTEKIYFGLNNKDGNGAAPFVPNVPYRIVSPTGVVAWASTMPDVGIEGNIPTWAQAVAGPIELGNAGGYDAILVQPLETGDYVIEFNPTGALNIHLFDITVADIAGVAIDGRVHSQGWQINTESFSNPFWGTLYPYAPSGTIYEVDFNQMIPYIFVINFNSTGTANTGDFFEDRKSKVGNSTYPEYQVFLNPPDQNLYPTKKPSINFSAEIIQVDCERVDLCLSFTANETGYVEGFIDVNGNNVYDSLAGDVYFGEFIDTPGTKCVPWNALDGSGNPITSNQISLVSSFGFGVTHLPLYDVEHSRNGYIVHVVEPTGIPDPLIYWDDSYITMGNTLGDVLVNLNGCNNPAGCHRWEDRGGLQSGNGGDQETINTWWYSQVVYDTVVFNLTQVNDVSLSYYPDSLVKGDTSMCVGDALDFFVYNDGLTHFDSSRYNYNWFLDGAQVTNDVSNWSEIIGQSSQVVVEAIDKNNVACISRDTLNFNAQPPVQISSVLQDETCNSLGSISINILNGPPNATISWAEFPGNTSGSLTNLIEGTYNLSISDPAYSANCSFDTSFAIAGAGQLAINDLILGPGACFDTIGSASLVMADPAGDYRFIWNNGPETTLSSQNNLTTGSHDVTVRLEGSSCTVDTAFVIPGGQNNYAIIKNDEICDDSKASVAISVTDPQTQILWSDNGSTNFTRANLSSGSYSFDLLNPADPACSASGTVNIQNITFPMTADFSYSSQLQYQINNITDIVTFENLSTGSFTSTQWTFGDGNGSSDFSPIYNYAGLGSFDVKLFISDTNGCFDETIQTIFIDEKPVCEAAVPSAFSPNHDMTNDDIGVLGDVNQLDLRIFNRWGEVIFRAESINERWDGIYRSLEAPIGVYPYTLDFWCPDESGKLSKNSSVGQITLVR